MSPADTATENGERLVWMLLIYFSGSTVILVWKGLKNLPCNFGWRADLAWLEHRSGLAEHWKILFSFKLHRKYRYLLSEACTERIHTASSKRDQMF